MGKLTDVRIRNWIKAGKSVAKADGGGLLTGTRSAEGTMASGHVNRINRPNTWLHRPVTRREVLTCQPGAVHTWH